MKAINIHEKFSKFDKQWHPHRIATVDDNQIYLAKLSGDFIWHSHEDEDELFHVIKGTLYMKFRDKTVTVQSGEIIVVPKGVEHSPSTKNNEEVHVLLFEKLSAKHTGEIQNERTVAQYIDL
ncbi:cupin domain-containing protein [Aquimarina muelleri]|uniref:Mannose-6-phosphate isomerase n=1 Tax=Aquimarina muelleri TaxID=279356 RepID=A0A918JTQ4_9FLAO|nr:cupin domain-containing protein [Aquimarina muelleri]MCX2761326.1 cupin domain-containing protein [Aquimarina muelleri]GGX12573.1 mannose-6-phosphate isomerase [Aquimarina muelleri]